MMSYSARTTPRSGKFAHLKHIRSDGQCRGGDPDSALGRATGRNAGTAAQPTSTIDTTTFEGNTVSTLQVIDRQREEVAVHEDTDERIRRHRYAQTVLRFADQAGQYHSLGLFLESMLREVETNGDADTATRAAIGTWALNLLSTQTDNGVLRAIADAVMPAIYCHYTPAALDRPSAAIRAQVSDPGVIRSNPYFTHSMYVEQRNVDRDAVTDLTAGLRRAIAANDLRRNHVVRRLAAERMSTVGTVFRAWRAQARRARLLANTNKSRSARQEAAVQRLRMQAFFYRWKTTLELSRNAFLTERLHEAAGQLENAKNQFQLQCYRADRLIQTSKEMKEELVRTYDINEDLQRRVHALKEELVLREQEYNAKLARSVASAMHLVQSYSGVVTTLAEAQMKPLPYQTEKATSEALAEEEDALYGEGRAADGGGPQSSSRQQQEWEGDETDETTALNTLRHWSNSVLRAVRGDRFRPLMGFGRDFADGEAYLVLLHYVFPEKASLGDNLESNVEYRLRRIKDMSVRCGLMHVLEPDDFLDKREDRIIQSLCELYTRHVDRQWAANAAAAASSFAEKLREADSVEQGREASIEVVDDASFQAHVAQCNERLATIKAELLEQGRLKDELAQSKERVKAEEAYLAAEERKGLPLLFVGEASTRPFWVLKPRAIEDLCSAEKIGNDTKLWAQLTTGPLPRTLKECAPVTSRLFCFYAGGNARVMSEFDFWRFVETQNFATSAPAVRKELVSQVFDSVASPQLAATIKAASYGRTDMDRQTLLSVARQELDIRHISPAQFVEILLRLGVEANGRSFGLVEGVGRFLRGMALPSKSLLGTAQAAFYEADSQYVVHFFSDDLARVFFFYMKRQESSKVAKDRAMATQDGGRFAGLLSTASYTCMLDDCVFLADGALASEAVGFGAASNVHATSSPDARKPRAFITTAQVEECLSELAKAYSSLKPGEITFTVFLESLFVMGNYWCPNPFVPPPRKLAAFLCDYITQLNNRHANSTLILGAPPHVPLEGGPKVDLTIRATDYM